jgi:hypothetical protein
VLGLIQRLRWMLETLSNQRLRTLQALGLLLLLLWRQLVADQCNLQAIGLEDEN